MRPDLDDALVRDFPNLYRDRGGDTSETRMCDGFPGDGWEPLIRRVSEKLEPFCAATGAHASQVKEKWGTLRFYMRTSDPLPLDIRKAMDEAHRESARTCEICGASGTLRSIWSIQTLCADCAQRVFDSLSEWQHDALRRRRERGGGRDRAQARRRKNDMNEKKTIRVFLDDVRDAPAGWTRVYTAHEAIALLEAGGVVEISLDHDLGNDDEYGTGYVVATWIEEHVALHGFVPPTIRIHSANVVGRARMQQAIDSIERLRQKTPR